MPNGKYCDHPINDLLVHNAHPFPCDMEAMIRKLNQVDPSSFGQLNLKPFAWAQRKDLDQGRQMLRSLLEKRGHDARVIALRAIIQHSLYLVGAVLFLGSGIAIWLFASSGVPVYPADSFDILNWIVPLGLATIGTALIIRWIRNR
ncbi:MAG TPA: hypothetical protein VN604_08710 [Nitrospirota bacterium]|nr:hypothetical protein [Nitrospirota bacterium]